MLIKRKKTLIRTAFVLGIIMFSTNICHAQTSKWFVTPGITFFTDNGRTEVFVREYKINDVDYIRYYRANYFTLFDVNFNYRYNLLEFNENFALGLNSGFAIGTSAGIIDDDSRSNDDNFCGVVKLNIPVYCSFELGAGSTQASIKDFGLTFGLGAEMNKVPLIETDGFGSDIYLDSFWIQPVAVLGVRFWTVRNKLSELNIKFGMGRKQDYPSLGGRRFDVSEYIDMTTYRPYTLRLSYKVFFNY